MIFPLLLVSNHNTRLPDNQIHGNILVGQLQVDFSHQVKVKSLKVKAANSSFIVSGLNIELHKLLTGKFNMFEKLKCFLDFNQLHQFALQLLILEVYHRKACHF